MSRIALLQHKGRNLANALEHSMDKIRVFQGDLASPISGHRVYGFRLLHSGSNQVRVRQTYQSPLFAEIATLRPKSAKSSVMSHS